MTDDALDKLIRGLNDGTVTRQVFLQHLKGNVSIATAWPEFPKGLVVCERGFRMFFIRDGRGPFAPTVLDMTRDLHIYVLPDHRKKGLMSIALKEIVLPFLFKDRTEQKVTFKDPKLARYLKNLGFRVAGKDSAVITSADVASVEFTPLKKVKCDQEKALLLKQRLWQAAGYVRICIEELATTGETIKTDLEEIEQVLVDAGFEIDDLSWKK